jgi:hypothetical protein
MPPDFDSAPPIQAGCDHPCPLPGFCCGIAGQIDICEARTDAALTGCETDASAPILCTDGSQCCPGTVCCAFPNGSINTWPSVTIIECMPPSQCASPNVRLCADGGECDPGQTCVSSGLAGLSVNQCQ